MSIEEDVHVYAYNMYVCMYVCMRIYIYIYMYIYIYICIICRDNIQEYTQFIGSQSICMILKQKTPVRNHGAGLFPHFGRSSIWRPQTHRRLDDSITRLSHVRKV